MKYRTEFIHLTLKRLLPKLFIGRIRDSTFIADFTQVNWIPRSSTIDCHTVWHAPILFYSSHISLPPCFRSRYPHPPPTRRKHFSFVRLHLFLRTCTCLTAYLSDWLTDWLISYSNPSETLPLCLLAEFSRLRPKETDASERDEFGGCLLKGRNLEFECFSGLARTTCLVLLSPFGISVTVERPLLSNIIVKCCSIFPCVINLFNYT